MTGLDGVVILTVGLALAVGLGCLAAGLERRERLRAARAEAAGGRHRRRDTAEWHAVGSGVHRGDSEG